ncbi:recombination regulator RecX [Thiotrichales bacterium 19S11-10]|nr:recombination regulator RecX [Thiotrichales bacterium 19S11-10]MCF6807704.1 recombination regulator RecX [Thiotrichales bacterium 19S9-11]MCF6811673.1 recombination regulator RecX [Thiotrichales bacterium 19S9-12]
MHYQSSMTNLDQKFKSARQYALTLLTQREYSAKELTEKLTKYLTADEACELVSSLAKEGLQSDYRFTESLIRFHMGQNRGFYKVQQHLKQKGIDVHIIETVLSELNPQWELLCLNRIEKYIKSDEDLQDFKVIEKLKRNLIYHGFSYDNINQAIKMIKEG